MCISRQVREFPSKQTPGRYVGIHQSQTISTTSEVQYELQESKVTVNVGRDLRNSVTLQSTVCLCNALPLFVKFISLQIFIKQISVCRRPRQIGRKQRQRTFSHNRQRGMSTEMQIGRMEAVQRPTHTNQVKTRQEACVSIKSSHLVGAFLGTNPQDIVVHEMQFPTESIHVTIFHNRECWHNLGGGG